MFGRLADWFARQLASKGAWHADGDAHWQTTVDRTVARVVELTGDRRGHLRAGGVVVVVDQATLDALRPPSPGRHTAACCEPGRIWLVARHPDPVALLAHEAAHLGLRRWEPRGLLRGPWGGVRLPTEAECDAIARELA